MLAAKTFAPQAAKADADAASHGPESASGSPPAIHGSLTNLVRRALPIATVLTIVLVVHARSLEGPFFWDDETLILESRAVREGASLSQWFFEPFWPPGLLQDEARGLYRPLALLSYRIDWLIHGENAAGFHLSNLLIHAANTLLLYLVTRRFGANRVAAAIAAGLWAMLPRLTECTAWISGRTDMLALAPVLVAFLAWPLDTAGNTRRAEPLRCLGAAVMLLAGLLSKEVAAAGLIALVAWEFRAAPELHRARRRPGLLVLGATAVIYGTLRFVSLGSGQTPSLGEASFTWKVGRVFAAAGTYLLMLVTPWNPQGQIGLTWSYDGVQVTLGIALLAIIIALCWIAWRSRSPSLVAISMLGAFSLLAVLHIVPLPSNVIAADRFLYVPCAAIALAGGQLASGLSRRRAIAAATLSSALAMACGIWTVRRIAQWNEPVAFWVHTCAGADPANYLPGGQLGILLDNAGYSEEALLFHANTLQKMAVLKRDLRMATANMAESFARLGQYENAGRGWHEVIRMDPARSHAWLRAGRIAAWLGDWNEARMLTQKAAQIDGEDPAVERQMESLAHWEQFEAELPDKSSAEMNRGKMLTRARLLTLLGRLREAEQAWRWVLEHRAEQDVQREGLDFHAGMAESRHALWALSLMARGADGFTGAESVRRKLQEKADENTRLEAHREAIRGCLARMNTLKPAD